MAKSIHTTLVETLEKAANLITPDENGFVPISDEAASASFAELGYRVGRALSLARRLKREKA